MHGVVNRSLSERLLREENITIANMVQICKAAKLTEEHRKAWNRIDRSVDTEMEEK